MSRANRIRLRSSTIDRGHFLEVSRDLLRVLDDEEVPLAVFRADQVGGVERVPFPRNLVSWHNTRLSDDSFRFQLLSGWSELEGLLRRNGWTGSLDLFGVGMSYDAAGGLDDPTAR